MKIIWGINIPYKSTEIDWEATDAKRKETGRWIDFVRVPCIRVHKEMSFDLCDVCGDQISWGRVKRGITTCCPEHNQRKWDSINGLIIEKERTAAGIRPTFFWQTIRYECFERDDYKCQGCKVDIKEHLRRGSKPPEAHHIKQIKDGGTNELSNLKTLCYECHKKEHSHIGRVMKQHRCLEV